jgi:RNA polymerase sigma-70 factor (ECF subfamily)
MQHMTMNTASRPRTYDHAELVKIYEDHNAEIYRYAYRLVGDSMVAEEFVSETFGRFLHGLRQDRQPVQNVRAYLFRIAHNLVVDHFRKSPAEDPLELVERIPDQQNEPSRLSSENRDRERIRAALRQLTPEQQMVVQLRFLEDWSHEEVAELLGKSSEASRALQYRALAALKSLLEQDKNAYEYGS